jgi:DNA helicase-2/ATP-dependent DNA helicase PcrA
MEIMFNASDTILNNLNAKQREAVESIEGPLLVLAGPGSGKTRVITHRIAYLTKIFGVAARNILAVTFTNKAAKEMSGRLESLIGADDVAYRNPTVGTFHSLGVRILRSHGSRIGIDKDFVIYDQADQLSTVRRCLDQLGLDPKRYNPNAILTGISGAKNQMLTVEKHAAKRTHYFEEIVHRVYELYNDLLNRAHAVDFDDLLMKSVLLFENEPEILKMYQDRYLYVLVDEYQDTNVCQYNIMNQIAGNHKNICAVGDPDQSIYSWRHANIQNILNFENDYPEAKTVLLDQNYRSTQPILDGAKAVIAPNKQRKDMPLWTDKESGSPINLIITSSEQEEAIAVVSEIVRLEREGLAQPGGCAIMYRTNAQSRALEDAFNRYGMPYHLIGGLRFWERKEIKDVIAYLRVIQNPSDDVSLNRIINVPNRSIGQKTVEELTIWSVKNNLPLHSALQMAGSSMEQSITDYSGPKLQTRAVKAIKTLLDLLDSFVKDSTNISIIELLDVVTEKTGYRKSLLDEEDGEERWDNVQELRTVAAQIEELDGGLALTAFLESASLASDIDKIEDESGAATLITLHQAKGLEFPTVFIVGVEDNLLPHSRSKEDPSQLEEERRIIYVGMTRAKERLYLLRATHRSLFGSRLSNPPSPFLANIPAMETHNNSQISTTRNNSTKLEMPAIDLRAGEHVQHPTYGEGIVIGILPETNDAQITVAFKGEAGVKRLLYSLAKLTKL